MRKSAKEPTGSASLFLGGVGNAVLAARTESKGTRLVMYF